MRLITQTELAYRSKYDLDALLALVLQDIAVILFLAIQPSLNNLQFALVLESVIRVGALIAARVLMGIGSCCYFMAPLTLYARRYPPERFATFVGVQYGLGTLGTLFATAPLALSRRYTSYQSSEAASFFWLSARPPKKKGASRAWTEPG